MQISFHLQVRYVSQNKWGSYIVGEDWVVGGGRNREQEGYRMWGRNGREITLSPHYVNNQ